MTTTIAHQKVQNTVLSEQAEVVLEHRYFLKDALGEITENSTDLFSRVAKAIAAVESMYYTLPIEAKLLESEFFDMMYKLEFLPNSPTLMNAGTEQGTLSACFVLPLEDSMEGIMKAATDAAMVQKFGGGTGFALSKIRPRGDRIKTTHGIACGPIEVLKTLSRVSSMITQGGKRDGANMAVMAINHPDILDFISCKSIEGEIHNFNIHVIEQFGEMIATNPCGEQPLLGNESCNLGSINLAQFYKAGMDVEWEDRIDWEHLEKVTRLSTHFLDNVIDANYYATQDIEDMTKATRKIGLGVMGFADLLIQLRVPYDSLVAREIGAKLIEKIRDWSDSESLKLGAIRGTFPAWDKSTYKITEAYRNHCRLTVAPTGTISMIADTSSGIEPTFALAWKKQNILEGKTLNYVNKYFKQEAKEQGFYSTQLMDYLADGGSLKQAQGMFNLPSWVANVYVTAPEISPEDHVLMQSAFQEHVDSGISKTINFANSATHKDVEEAYILAWQTGCKGITVYRAGSREKEVLVKGNLEQPMSLGTEPCCDNPYIVHEAGCEVCKTCGWSACLVA